MQTHEGRRAVIAIRIGIVAAAAWFEFQVVTESAKPSRYFHYGFETVPPFVYPTGSVAVTCGLVALEAAAVWILLEWRRLRSLRSRSLVAFAIFGPLTILLTPTILHAPPWHAYHLFWLWAVVKGLFLIGLVASLHHLVNWLAARRIHRDPGGR